LSGERQLAALLQVIEQYRAARCREMLEAARAQAARTIAQARDAAARRLRACLAAEREGRDRTIAAAAARLGTQRRLLRQRRIAAALKTGWTRLEVELAARWNSRAGRDIWVARRLAAARTWLLADPGGSPASGRPVPGADQLQVEHPPAWDAQERERTQRLLAEHGFQTVQFVARPDIVAGLRIRCGHNVLDATAQGLLAERAAVEGRLLDRLGVDEP
jgi:hypothetical protein